MDLIAYFKHLKKGYNTNISKNIKEDSSALSGETKSSEEAYENYQQKLENEIKHYEKIFKGELFQEVPDVWNKVEQHFSSRRKKITGVSGLYEYVERHVKENQHVSMLGLGSGACGPELDGICPLLKKKGCSIDLTCVDINRSVLEKAYEEAKKRNVKLIPMVQDINQITLEELKFDVVVAVASLHHFIELDHITKEINKALKRDGIFVTVDIPTRNGYLMWDETLDVVNRLWKILPPKFKIDHTGFAKSTYVDGYQNINYAENSMECINSEAIITSLRKNLDEEAFVPAFSIARRFFDTKFGPNYDLTKPLDNSIFEFIMNLDTYYLENGILKPETFFGAYSKKYPGKPKIEKYREDISILQHQFERIVFGDNLELISVEPIITSVVPGEVIQFKIVWRFYMPLPEDKLIAYYIGSAENPVVTFTDTQEFCKDGRKYQDISPGEQVVDIVTLYIPPTTPSGTYEVSTFVYPPDGYDLPSAMRSKIHPNQKFLYTLEVK